MNRGISDSNRLKVKTHLDHQLSPVIDKIGSKDELITSLCLYND